MIKYALQMLKEAQWQYDENPNQYNRGVLTGVKRIVKLIQRQSKEKK